MTKNKQLIYPMGILLIGVLAFAGLKSLKKPAEEKEPEDNTPIVSVETIVIEDVQLKVHSYGIVKPKYETELVSQVSGAIVELSPNFLVGGFIQKGQLLARIDPSDYETALIDAEASLASTLAALQLEEAKGQMAERDWKRISKTSPSKLSLRKPQLAQEQARVKAAEAALKRSQRDLQRTKIVAPYDAMIASRNVGLGSFVNSGVKLGKVLSVSTAEVRLPVPDAQLQYLSDQGKGANVSLSVESGGQKRHWPAKIVRSEGVIDTDSRMSYLVAEVKQPYAQPEGKPPIWFGSYVNAEIEGVLIPQAAVVPRHLISDNQLAVLDSEQKLRFTSVDIVRADGGNVVIRAGIEPGAQLIVSAIDYPVDGMPLAVMGEIEDKDSADGKDVEEVGVEGDAHLAMDKE